MLSTKNIKLDYLDGIEKRTILSDISLEFNDNEMTFILGPSGSGKSSLLYILSLLRQPTSGSVFLDGKELSYQKNKAAATRFENFGFVFQNHFLIQHLNVLDNVCMADRKHISKDEATDMLKKLGLEKHIKQKIYKLSGGERQRVAIARALIKKPKILFADEPTASLDRANSEMIMDIFNTIKKNTAIICATHDVEIIPDAARKIYLRDGKIKE